jgi:hypothetical protein
MNQSYRRLSSRQEQNAGRINCDEPPGRASAPPGGHVCPAMGVPMKVLSNTAHRPLTKCPRIVIHAIGLVISAVFVASPEDAIKFNDTLDSMASTACQPSGSNRRLPDQSVEKEQNPNGPRDRKADVSQDEARCGEETVFQSANSAGYSRLRLEASSMGTDIETLRNLESKQSDGRVTKFVPTFPQDSSTSMTTRRTQTSAVPSCLQRVTIASNPCGATIYLDGIQTGRTPMRFPVPPGRYTLILLAPGHQMYGKRILVPDGPLEINVNLIPDR